MKNAPQRQEFRQTPPPRTTIQTAAANMHAIFSNAATWQSPFWPTNCGRERADRVILIRNGEPWNIALIKAVEDELTARDLPVGWDVEAANAAIDQLLGDPT